MGAAVLAAIGPHVYAQRYEIDPLSYAYDENCSVCYGENLEGTGQGTPLVGVDFRHGDSLEEVIASIANGFPAQGMPGWSELLPEAQIRKLAIYMGPAAGSVSMAPGTSSSASASRAGLWVCALGAWRSGAGRRVAPSDSTVCRVLADTDPDALQDVLRRWAAPRLAEDADMPALAADGARPSLACGSAARTATRAAPTSRP